KARGLRILALTTEAVSEDGTRPDVKPAKRFVKKSKFPFEIGATDANGLRLLTVLHNQSFVRERPLPLPTSFLIDKHGNLAAIYKGPVKGAQLLADIDLLDAAPAAVVESAFPFPSRDGLELFPLAVLDFAKAYQEGGYIDDARRQARKAIDAKPTGNVAVDAANRARAWYYLGTLEQSQRNWKEAAQAYRLTIEFSPGQPLLEVALGVVLWQGGEQEAAEHSFTKALAAKPDDLQILHALGKAHLQLDRAPDAVRYLEKALALKPDNLTLALALALAFDMAGNTRAAISNYREILKAHPDSLDSKNNLAWILATCSDSTMRDGETALALATEVNQTTKFNNPSTLNTLAAAQGESGDLSAAIKTMERAIDIARAIGRDSLVSKLRARRTQYTSKLHESSPPKE
ncbi:MAG: tetratricopeptide repeat protein, partial [Akkermansiaceae bacterium]